MNRPTWVEYGLDLALMASMRSEDPFRKVGAVIFRPDWSIASTGYNGAPRGVELDWNNREERRKWVIHAEMNALAYVTRNDILANGRLCCTHMPCEKCMPMLAAHGIVQIFYSEPYVNPELGIDPEDIRDMALKLGIDIVQGNSKYGRS